MRQILPEPLADVDPITTYADDERSTVGDRPWLLLNMVTSIDGASAVDGRSGDLGGTADKEVFRAIRAVADVVMVGAGTARAERYRAPTLPDEATAERARRGRADVPRLAMVSRSLDLDAVPAVGGPGAAPIVLTFPEAPEGRRRALEGVVELIDGPAGPFHVVEALRSLRARFGAEVVLCEGGPSLNAALVEADVVDEICLTIDPSVVGGPSHRIVDGAPASSHRFALTRVLDADGVLFLRYVRRR